MEDLTGGAKHYYRTGYKILRGTRFEIAEDNNWCGYDLRDAPYSISIRDTKRKITLHTVMLYQFKTRKEAEEFCDYCVRSGSIEEMKEELITHHFDLSQILSERFMSQSREFEENLKQAHLTYLEFEGLMAEYKNLPAYIRKYIKNKYKNTKAEAL